VSVERRLRLPLGRVSVHDLKKLRDARDVEQTVEVVWGAYEAQLNALRAAKRKRSRATDPHQPSPCSRDCNNANYGTPLHAVPAIICVKHNRLFTPLGFISS
jgi:hypothetical protein